MSPYEPSSEFAYEISENAKILMAEYTSQIPAHSTYIISGILGLIASIIAVIFAIPNYLGHSSIEVRIGYFSLAIVSVLIIFGLYGLKSYGRLLYYTLQITILKEILGVCGESNQDYYLSLFARGISELKLGALDKLVLWEMLYRIKHGVFDFETDKDGNTSQKAGRKMITRYKRWSIRIANLNILSKNDSGIGKIGKYHYDQCNTLPVVKQSTA